MVKLSGVQIDAADCDESGAIENRASSRAAKSVRGRFAGESEESQSLLEMSCAGAVKGGGIHQVLRLASRSRFTTVGVADDGLGV